MTRGRLLKTSCWAAVLLGGVGVVIASFAAAQSAHHPSTSMQRVAVDRAGPAGFADLAEKVKPAVIGVSSKIAVSGTATTGLGFGASGRGSSHLRLPPDRPAHGRAPIKGEVTTMGSGFFISPDGYAVTNDHVVGHSNTVQVRTNDNKTFTAKVVGRDPLSDLALIKVEGGKNFSYVKLADRPPRVGDWVLTVGSPYGLGGSVTAGIVSARGRSIKSRSAEDFLQIDAPINKGDSGGPSFNTDGKVVGVNSMILSPSGGSAGIAFAVPADTVKTVIPQLKAKGSVTRGWMGVRIQSVTPDIASSLGMNNVRGAIVASVQSNSPAAKAGLTSGDVITSVAGASISNARQLSKKIYATAPGSSVRLGVLRRGKQSAVSVRLAQMPNQQAAWSAAPQR
ncbi:MAG: S1C family serine protease [Bradyrhizobium sp.]